MDWIKVSDRLPQPGVDVLIVCANEIHIGFWITGDGNGMWTIVNNEEWIPDADMTTHWMPLPELPKEGQ